MTDAERAPRRFGSVPRGYARRMPADTLPRKIVDLNVTVARQAADRAGCIARSVAEHTGRVLDRSVVAGRTVVGQLRSTGERTTDTAEQGAREVAGQARTAATRTARTAEQGGRQVAGQTRSAVSRTAKTAEQGGREVAGQAEAQGAAVAGTAEREANRAVDRAADAVGDTPGSGVAYEDWTRAQLYERAQELDIDGRATMNKADLIDALRAHS